MKVSIPFDQRVFRDFRLFVVPALIENQGRSLYLPMIIDSAGASYLTVRPDVFDQLGIAPVREAPLVTALERAVALKAVITPLSLLLAQQGVMCPDETSAVLMKIFDGCEDMAPAIRERLDED